MKSVNLAVVGATGAVGEAVLDLLQEHQFPVKNLHLLASDRTAGTRLMFNSKPLMVTDLKNFDFSQADIAMFVATDAVSEASVPLAQAKGCLVIDNSQVFSDSAPLIVPQVNGRLLAAKPELIVNPDSNAIQLTTILKPFYDQLGIDRINVTVCQSVSSQGKKAMHELASQTINLLSGRESEASVYRQQIAFNMLPNIGDIGIDGHSVVEKRLLSQTRRIMGDENLNLNATCVLAPVFCADSMVLTFDCQQPISLEETRELLEKNNEIKVVDDAAGDEMATPVTHATGSDKIFISRIRRDMSHKQGINLWITTDTIRKTAAINTILIAEELIKSYL